MPSGQQQIVRAILLETKRLLLTVGWTQSAAGRFKNDLRAIGDGSLVCAVQNNECGGLCLTGAVYVASELVQAALVLRALYRSDCHLKLRYVLPPGEIDWGLVTWNDSGDRTRDEVLALIDRAIANMENPDATRDSEPPEPG